MQHILFKIYSRKFSWKLAKSYDIDGNTEILKLVQGDSTKKLTSDHFRRLAKDMDRAGIKSIRITKIKDDMYIILND